MHINFIGAERVRCALGHYFKHQGLYINNSPLSSDVLKLNHIFITKPDDTIGFLSSSVFVDAKRGELI